MYEPCLNCGNTNTGKFCSACGQKSNTNRITLTAILHQVPHSVLNIDKGLLFTFIQLTYRPGKAISDYLHGKRAQYFSPIAYLLFLCAASSFIIHITTEYLHLHYSFSSRLLFPDIAEFFSRYPALMLCILTPFITFWAWLFNRHRQYNYWEVFILNIYLIAQFNIFFIVDNLLKISGVYRSGSVTPMLLCFLGYLVFAYLQFFPGEVTFKRAVKNTLMFILLSLTLLTGLTVCGFMTPWWGNIR